MFKIKPAVEGTETDRMMGINRVTGMLLAALSLSGPVPAAGEQVQINTVELHAYGIMEPSQVDMVKVATAGNPQVDHIKGVRFTRNTHRIIASPHTNFGISYTVNGARAGATLDVVHTLVFPTGGLEDTAGNHYDTATEELVIETGKPVIYGYGFDEEWERVPGEWVFQVWYNNTRILQKTFTVLPEPPAEGHSLSQGVE